MLYWGFGGPDYSIIAHCLIRFQCIRTCHAFSRCQYDKYSCCACFCSNYVDTVPDSSSFVLKTVSDSPLRETLKLRDRLTVYSQIWLSNGSSNMHSWTLSRHWHTLSLDWGSVWTWDIPISYDLAWVHILFLMIHKEVEEPAMCAQQALEISRAQCPIRRPLFTSCLLYVIVGSGASRLSCSRLVQGVFECQHQFSNSLDPCCRGQCRKDSTLHFFLAIPLLKWL